MAIEELLMGGANAVWGVAGRLPWSHILAVVLVVILIVYAMAEKLKGLLIWAGVQLVLYITTRDNVSVLAESVNATMPSLPGWNPLVYMDRALGYASRFPSSEPRTDLVVVVLISYLFLYLYYMYLFGGAAQKHGRGEWIPLLGVFLALGSTGGGTGLLRFLKITKIHPLGIAVSLRALLFIIIIIYFVALFYIEFVGPGRHRRSLEKADRTQRWQKAHGYGPPPSLPHQGFGDQQQQGRRRGRRRW